MKKEAFTVGQTIESMCSVCEVDQKHVVRAVTKLGAITQAACEACETVTTFSRGAKTSVSVGKGKNASPYDRTRVYRKGQSMMHDKFGRGEVTAVVDSNKIDVLFGDQTRRMIHAQN
ncbi:MAG: hypothetical protein JO053_10250 [Acidobacteria bacterium]|nr:hypothetical protein [Acidobacteriota bacterium]